MRKNDFTAMIFDWYFTERFLNREASCVLDWATRPVEALSRELGRREAKRLLRALETVNEKINYVGDDKRELHKCRLWKKLFRRTNKIVLYDLEYRARRVLRRPKLRLSPDTRTPPPYRERHPLSSMKEAANADSFFLAGANEEIRRLHEEIENHYRPAAVEED